MSPRRLFGWEPATRTRHEYGPDGALLETVHLPEPEWDHYQLTLMLAHLAEKNEPRNGLGIPLTEATNPDFDPATWGKRFQAVGPKTDFAEKALAEAKKAYYENRPNHDRAGDLWTVRVVGDD